MIKLIRDLKKICEYLYEEIDGNLQDEDLLEMKEQVENIDNDIQKLISGIRGFQNLKMNVLNTDRRVEYEQAYSDIIYGLARVSTYLEDFHMLVFKVNKKRMLLEGEITQEEYDASDVLEIEYVDNIDEED